MDLKSKNEISVDMKYVPLTMEHSRIVSLFKGFAILLVVLIHSDGRKLMHLEQFTIPDVYLQMLCSEIAFDAVPIFFFISGYLFFLKRDSYTEKWKRRVKSLLVPYLIWCVLIFLVLFFFQRVLGLSHLFQGGHLKHVVDFSLLDYVRIFWDIRDGAPILSTLWFLRNLIILVLLTPLVSIACKKMGLLLPLLLLGNYLYFHYTFFCVLSGDMFFFVTGCYMALKYSGDGIAKIDRLNTKWVICAWIGCLIASVFAYVHSDLYEIFRRLFIVVDCIAMYKLIAYLVRKYPMLWLQKISAASFFIYLFHEPWLGYFQGFFFKYIHVGGVFLYLMPFFFCLFAIGYSYVVYLFLKRFAPRLLNVITGAR